MWRWYLVPAAFGLAAGAAWVWWLEPVGVILGLTAVVILEHYWTRGRLERHRGPRDWTAEEILRQEG